MLEEVSLVRNGIRDENMAALIESFDHLKRFNSLIIKHNEFNMNSMLALTPILKRGPGINLQELRLVSCKTLPIVIDDLLTIVSENCTLTRLGLVEAQLGPSHVDKLKTLIRTGKSLRELDLSWNGMGITSMLKLSEELAKNRTLTTVNLSWNYLTVSKNVKTLPPMEPELKAMLKAIKGEEEEHMNHLT